MATRTTPDIEILVGVEGGGSISGSSGVKIRNQLTNIISNINKQQATQLRLKVDQQYIQNQIANAIKTMPPVDLNVKVNPNGGGGGGSNSIANQIQKLGSLRSELYRKKGQLLDVSATSKQSVELNRQIAELQKKIGVEAQKYATTSGKTPTEIKKQVDALNSVTKSADAYNLKVQKINDTYDSLKNKISEYSQNAQSAYTNMSANNQSTSTKWADYDKKYQEFMTKANGIAGGMFNKGDSYEQIKQLQDIVKLYNDLQVLQKGVAAESEKVKRSNENGERAIQKYAENIYNFYKQIKDVAPANMSNNILNLFNEVVDGKWGSNITGLVKRFAELRNEVYKAQADVETFGQKIARVFKQKIGYGIMAAAAMKLRQSLRQLYTNVVEMDSAMTQLRIVTNDTDAAYTRFATNAAKAAKSIGASVTDIMKSAETYARLGYTLDESLNLSKTTAQLANVAATDADTATTFMTSILKGFNKNASDAESIGDMLTLVGKKYAISAEELGAALERGGASMAAANNSLEESIALLAAGNAAVQNADSVGVAFKTTTMRIRGSSAEDLEEAGLATDGLCESTSKLRKEIKALSGVDIMLNEDTYKSTYQILLEIANVWDRMSDINQATLLEDLAGKRNSQVLMSVIQNIDDLKGAYADAQNASGTMADATATYLDSINGKISQLSAAYQDFSARILDNSIIKKLLDFANGTVDAFNRFDEATNGAASEAIGFTVAITGIFIAIETLNKVLSIKAVQTWATNLASGFSMIRGVVASGGLSDIIALLQLMPGVAIAAGVAIAGIGYYAYKAYKDAHPSLKDLKEDLDDLKQTSSETKKEIDENAERIIALRELADNGTITLTEQDELDRLREENKLLAQRYEIQQALIAQKKESVQSATRSKAEVYLSDGQDVYDGFVGAVTGHINSGNEQLQEDISEYKRYTNLIEAEYKQAASEQRDINEDLIRNYENLRDQRGTSLQEEADIIYEMISDLDPQEDIDLINQLQQLLDKVQIVTGGPSAVGSVVEQTLNSKYFSEATQKLKDLANAGNLTEESVSRLNNALVNELIKYLQDVCDFSWDNVGELANQLRNVESASIDASINLKGVADDLKAVTDKYDLLYDAQKEFESAGAISTDTLSSLASKFPELEDEIGLYIAGLKTGKDLLSDISVAYQNDVSAYKKALAEKLAASPEFYNSLAENQKTYINDLATSYGVDLKNFKDLETAKLQFQADIIKKLAANSARFHGSTIEELKAYQASVQSSLQYVTDPRQKSYLASELTNVTNSLAAISRFQKEMDDIAMNGVQYDPSRYSPSKIKDDSKSGTDKYKQEVEKQIKILQHKREMDLITDRQYYEGLREIENAYYKDSEKHKKDYAEEIWDLDQEIFNGMRDIRTDWFSDQEKMAENFSLMGDINSQRLLYEDILKEAEKAINEAHEYGLDENNEYVQELRDQYHKTCQAIVSMVQDAYDDFKSYADDFNMWGKFDFTQVEFLEKNLREIKKLYEEGKLGWTEYVEAYNKVAKDLYDTKKDSIETIIDMTMQMIEQEANDEIDALDDQIDKLGKIIDLKKKLLQDTNDEADHEKKVEDAVAEIAKLQSKIAQLSLDDSRSAYAQRVDLESQLADKQKELADLQSEYTLDKTMDTLDETKQAKEDAAEDEKEAIEKSIDSWVKKYNLAIKRIDGDWDGLYKDLNNWMSEHRDSIDGPDSLKTAWENVDQMVRQTGQDIESIYNGNGNIGINPNSPQSILNAMKQNSEIAKENGSAQFNGRNLHEENNKLAAQYEKLTGIKLTYDSSKGWLKPDGSLAYTISSSGSVNAVPSSGSSSVITASYGEQGSSNVRWIQSKLASYGLKQPVDGNYWQTTAANVAAFAKDHGITTNGKSFTKELYELLKKYHTGGIVDGAGSLNDKEVLAILKKGELVLNDGQKANLHSVMQSLSDAVTVVNRAKPLFSKNAYGATQNMTTFAPQLSVTISHNGKMTDADADRYGNRIGNIALETMYKTMRTRGIKG